MENIGNAPKRESAVESARIRLNQAIGMAHENFAELRRRLIPVLNQRPTCAEEEKAPSPTTPLVGELDGMARNVCALSQNIQTVLEELEL